MQNPLKCATRKDYEPNYQPKKELTIISRLREALHAPEVCARFRTAPTNWTRQRTLTFARTAILLLQGHKFPMQNALNKFFTHLGSVEEVPTASAYCQARRKLAPELFQYLNSVVTSSYTALSVADESLRLWRSRRVLAIDGTYLNVPDTAATRAAFSLQTNQHASGARVQALGSILYDVLNDFGVHAALSAKRGEREFIFDEHLAHTAAGDVIVMDRLYADSVVMAFWVKHLRDFVVRFPRSSFVAVEEFWNSGEAERVVSIEVPPAKRKEARRLGVPTSFALRLVRVTLESGETEVLGTSLFDTADERFTPAEFKVIYGMRWGIETYFDRLKNIFEVERFSGASVQSICQDYYGVVFLASLESVLSKSAESELVEASEEKQTRHVAQVNHAVSYAALIEHVVALLVDEAASVEQTLAALTHLFKTNPTRRREGRTYPRDNLHSHSRKAWFARYTKRIVA